MDRGGAGYPFPSLTDDMIKADARLWASAATEHELKAYLWAAYCELPKATKSRFRRNVLGEGR